MFYRLPTNNDNIRTKMKKIRKNKNYQKNDNTNDNKIGNKNNTNW